MAKKKFVKLHEKPADTLKQEGSDNGFTIKINSPAAFGLPSEQPNILELAHNVVYGRGESEYGHPTENFSCTADMWTAFYRQRVRALKREGLSVEDFEFTPLDVAQFLIMVKTARLANTPEHQDSVIDQAGYAATYDRVLTGR